MKHYVDLNGHTHDLTALDADERRLLSRLKRYVAGHSTADYRNKWMAEVANFYGKRGLSRSEIVRTGLYRVAQDIGSRQQVAAGEARLPDYRDQLQELIRTQFATRRAFCEATGLSEDMLSHVLSRRKHLSIERLTAALESVGYGLKISRLGKSGEKRETAT